MSIDEIDKLILAAVDEFISVTKDGGDVNYAKGYLDALIDVRRKARGISGEVIGVVAALGCAFPY